MNAGDRSAASGAVMKTWHGGRKGAIESPATPRRRPTPTLIQRPTDCSHMPDTLTITDNRTGKLYEIPITDGAIRATDLRQIKVGKDDQGLGTYDPAFMNTASCRSRITYIDGDKGISNTAAIRSSSLPNSP